MDAKKKKVILAMLTSLTGISILTATSAVVAYEAIFPRCERPDYALKAGEYCYDRVKETLPRSELYYQIHGTNLKGYYYESFQKKGLIIVSHGIHAGGDDYLPLIKYMVNAGYNVFSYDCTGTYDSEGEDTVGMCQSLIDLEGTIKYIKSLDAFKCMPLFLIGHSWGGYAAASVLALCGEYVQGCATIAAMNNGCTMMVEKAEEYVGTKLARLPEPVFRVYQKLLFEDYVDYDGVRGINSVSIPVLVAHGVGDKVINFDRQSIFSYQPQITNPNVEYYIGKGTQGDHNNIWHSTRAALYQQQVAKDLKILEQRKGDKLTYEEKAAFFKTVDHALYSEVNEELMSQIVKMFDKTL